MNNFSPIHLDARLVLIIHVTAVRKWLYFYFNQQACLFQVTGMLCHLSVSAIRCLMEDTGKLFFFLTFITCVQNSMQIQRYSLEIYCEVNTPVTKSGENLAGNILPFTTRMMVS